MSVDLHRDAERLLTEAEQARREGRSEDARKLIATAAEKEHAALQLVPSDRLRTRGILAVSSVSLLDQAGESAAALRRAFEYLSLDALPTETRDFYWTSPWLNARKSSCMT